MATTQCCQAPQDASTARVVQQDSSPLHPIYLDAQATSFVDPRVVDAMLPYYISHFGNPHSRTHAYGWECEKAVETARKEVAMLINAEPREIIFTSGATESNNLAIKGVSRFYSPKKKHLITSQTEHKCVLASCRALENEGFEVTYLPLKKNGLIDLQILEASIRPDTVLVSIMTVNNEIGVRQPIEDIGAICRAKGVLFHTDCAQALGKVKLDVDAMNVDMMSLSSHKVYGPQGLGALYIRRRSNIDLQAVQSGGGQERGIRSGTLPTALVVGFGAACRVAREELEADSEHIARLSRRLIDGITSKLTHVYLNGDPDHRYHGCVNLSFAYIEGDSLLQALKAIALSSGSACTSASVEPSYVLRAIGVEDDLAYASIRFGIGRFTTEEEIDFTIGQVVEHANRLREMNPKWKMVSGGTK